MSEFNKRISLQRKVLKEVNQYNIFDEPLLSLTHKSIERWIYNNNIDNDALIVSYLFEISKKLFFLANKSQEQISDQYRHQESEVNAMISLIKDEVKKTYLVY